MTFDDRLLSQCVGCGFCLPACPTFQVTRREEHGPRGRIAAMRLVQSGEVPGNDAGYVASMETCVQCRACEPACPSGVRFGALMERARAELSKPSRGQPGSVRREAPLGRTVTRALLLILEWRPLLTAVSVGLSLLQLLRLDRLMPPRLRIPRRIRLLDLVRPSPSGPGGEAAYLFRGCVMDAWFRPVHRATARVLLHAGFEVRTDPAPPCCGAIHLHLGLDDRARKLAAGVVRSFEGTEGIVVVNSAGCGAAMKEYGRLLGTDEAERFSSRVRDFSEALSGRELPGLVTVHGEVTYQAACHLKNVQRTDGFATEALARVPGLGVHRPDDGELCCGAGGAYSLLQPHLAQAMRERKVAALGGADITEVVTANPGCMLHLAGAGLHVRHVAEVLDEALPPARDGASASG